MNDQIRIYRDGRLLHAVDFLPLSFVAQVGDRLRFDRQHWFEWNGTGWNHIDVEGIINELLKA